MAVGRGHACTPITEITGIAAASEHFPSPDRSFKIAIFFISIYLYLLFDLILLHQHTTMVYTYKHPIQHNFRGTVYDFYI